MDADQIWSEVEGDIEKVNNILKITQIRVKFHLKVPSSKRQAADRALEQYIAACPAAQSLIGCIEIRDQAEIEEVAG